MALYRIRNKRHVRAQTQEIPSGPIGGLVAYRSFAAPQIFEVGDLIEPTPVELATMGDRFELVEEGSEPAPTAAQDVPAASATPHHSRRPA